MDILKLICPDSSHIHYGIGISRCLDDIILGFGASIITIVIIIALAITSRTTRGRRKIYLYEKVFLLLLPVIGACIACYDITMLLSNTRRGHPSLYHEWLLRCSQLLLWATILLLSRFDCWLIVLSNWVLCVWWIIKLLLGIPILQATFSSMEAFSCINESLIYLEDVLFGILINIIRMKQASCRKRSMSNKRGQIFSTPNPPHEDVPGTPIAIEDIQPLSPANQRVVPQLPANLLDIEELEDNGNDVYWNWAFNNLFPENPPPEDEDHPQNRQQPRVEQQLGHEEPEDEYVPNDPWAVDNDADEETLNRWWNHDPWEDERNIDSDYSFDSIFND